MATSKGETPARRPGRPTKYTAETPEQAKKLCALGATDAELADFFGVSVRTVDLWKVQHKEFSQALNARKKLADDRVEQSLFRRAIGYECDEVDIRVVGTKLVKTPIRKVYPPDTTACIFWLKNRRRQQWTTEGEGGGAADVAKALSEVLQRMPS